MGSRTLPIKPKWLAFLTCSLVCRYLGVCFLRTPVLRRFQRETNLKPSHLGPPYLNTYPCPPCSSENMHTHLYTHVSFCSSLSLALKDPTWPCSLLGLVRTGKQLQTSILRGGLSIILIKQHWTRAFLGHSGSLKHGPKTSEAKGVWRHLGLMGQVLGPKVEQFIHSQDCSIFPTCSQGCQK